MIQQAQGSYVVNISDDNGCVAVDSVSLVTQQLILTYTESMTNASCYNNDGNVSISVDNGAAPYTYLWSNGETNQSLMGIGSGTYSIAITDSNGCVVSDTVIVNNSLVPNSVPICIITVDSTSTKNLIIWEKPMGAPIDSFRIYREVASVYAYVGSVEYINLSKFVDNTIGVNPNTTAYKYKLAVVDTCGNESILSQFHQTIHLQINVAFPQGVNLSWNDYNGFSILQYYILRDAQGDGNWIVIDSVSYGTTSYTSTDVLPNANYIVEARKSDPCNPLREAINIVASTRSNVASTLTSVKEFQDPLYFSIAPNPTDGQFRIKVNHNSVIKIYNTLGEQVYQTNAHMNSNYEIDFSDFPKGVYFVKINNEKEIATKKIIVK